MPATDDADAVAAHRVSLHGLLALTRVLPTYYQGTVPAHVKARRRAKDKVARNSRRINRGGKP